MAQPSAAISLKEPFAKPPLEPAGARRIAEISVEREAGSVARGFALGVLLSLPVWGLIAWAVWRVA